MKNDTIDAIRELNHFTDEQAAEAVRPEVGADLLAAIISTPLPADPAPVAPGHSLPTRPGTQGRIIGRLVPGAVVAGLLAATVLVTVGRPSDDTPQALSFTTQGNQIVVRVLDPKADSERYNAEFRKRGLDIKLKLLPVSPSSVGQNVGVETSGPTDPTKDIKVFDDPQDCMMEGSYPCVPGFKIPRDFKGAAVLYFGRAAAPDERYAVGGSIDARNEPLDGVRWQNRPVAEVVKILASRGYTVEKFYVGVYPELKGQARKTVPGAWRVTGATAWKHGSVIMWAAPTPPR
ncbi:MAG TPA: hypothetical protein VGD71_42160 [Kribbella sp.]